MCQSTRLYFCPRYVSVEGITSIKLYKSQPQKAEILFRCDVLNTYCCTYPQSDTNLSRLWAESHLSQHVCSNKGLGSITHMKEEYQLTALTIQRHFTWTVYGKQKRVLCKSAKTKVTTKPRELWSIVSIGNTVGREDFYVRWKLCSLQEMPMSNWQFTSPSVCFNSRNKMKVMLLLLNLSSKRKDC